MQTAQHTRRIPLAVPALVPPARWAVIALLAILYYLGANVAVHVIRADLDPTVKTASQYANGPHSYLMSSAFIASGCGVLALAMGLYWAVKPRPRIPVLLLGVGAVAAGLIAAFPTVEGVDRLVRAEAIHDGVSVLSFVAGNAAMYVFWFSFRRDPRWCPAARRTLVLSLCGTASFIAFAVTSEGTMIGVAQRLAMLAVYVWLLSTAIRLLSAPRRSA